jgi:hypothetical protein
MPDPFAKAADYADALITARRAKNWLFLLLLLTLLIQLGVFLAARYTQMIIAPTTNRAIEPRQVLRYLVGFSDFAGIALAIVLSIVLVLIVQIMLVGRTLGVSRLTAAFIWSLVLIVLVFPWQAFLDSYVFKIPGALYTWDELIGGAKFSAANFAEATLHWSRFVAFPVVALILLFAVQVQSTRGLKMALGQADVTPEDRM